MESALARRIIYKIAFLQQPLAQNFSYCISLISFIYAEMLWTYQEKACAEEMQSAYLLL